MALDINHHCPVCSKKGNRRCLKLGHLIESRAREEKVAKKDHNSSNVEHEDKQQQKNAKRAKVKSAHEKTMKQLRKEMRQEKRASSSD
ncbi:hypothetical protein J7T55_003194 [Diaporthe amygdali]|uniref:uncharacterized protein n=1 Tax=Phomopsis amygdali TaxID=1214568 RepID=UPI0022FF191A|nr:uncharacterized protein J7T55_003194 [Diaporthe amygdali]KAJ0122678.1 hypothetical protein J7T55_003194 [Diaporthe amygdali]